MNPSASGWIKKHQTAFESQIQSYQYNADDFYNQLKKIGFIYANSIATITYPKGTTYRLTPEEISKINLFDSLGYVFFEHNPKAQYRDFLQRASDFYKYLKSNSWFHFEIPFAKPSIATQLEKIIEKRIQTNQNIFQKSFSSLVANALLYLDVLIFSHYLKMESNPLHYAKSLEALIANTIYLAIRKKTKKDEQDQLVLKMLEVSIRYNTIDDIALEFQDLGYQKHESRKECRYILDLTCMTIYADEIVEEPEKVFAQNLGKRLGFQPLEIQDSICDAQLFIKDNIDRITFLDQSNPFKNLYDNTHSKVKTLVLRNKKRLIQELRQSGELLMLLRKSQSTVLNEEEKAKVKTQLLDICKVIPSLGIFILPGGSILLPILIKFIPDLLPSAFADNK